MLFPILCAHMNGSGIQHFDLKWRSLCGITAHLVADLGGKMFETFN